VNGLVTRNAMAKCEEYGLCTLWQDRAPGEQYSGWLPVPAGTPGATHDLNRLVVACRWDRRPPAGCSNDQRPPSWPGGVDAPVRAAQAQQAPSRPARRPARVLSLIAIRPRR
jgi:hypothetical protein